MLPILSNHLPQLPVQATRIAPGNPVQSLLSPSCLADPCSKHLLRSSQFVKLLHEAFKNQLKTHILDKDALQETSCPGCSLFAGCNDSDLWHCTWTALHCGFFLSPSLTLPQLDHEVPGFGVSYWFLQYLTCFPHTMDAHERFNGIILQQLPH